MKEVTKEYINERKTIKRKKKRETR